MLDKNNNELTVTEGFAVLANQDVLNEALADDCQGLEFSFDRVKLPTGGGTAFEIPSAEGEESEMAKDITGVIVYNHPAFAYYHDKYNGGNNPPDCGSFDGVMGIGNPGGNCAGCPYNKFGSGDGQSKLCKNKRMLYILREGELFPITISLPTGSLKSFTNYVKSQLSRGRKLNQVVTKITLKKATNASGIAFSQAVFAFVRMLTAEERNAVAGVTEGIINAYTRKTGLSRNKISKLMDDETWLNAEKAQQLGFADGILFDDKDRKKSSVPEKEESNPDEKQMSMLYSPIQTTASLMQKISAITPKGVPINQLDKRLALLKD